MCERILLISVLGSEVVVFESCIVSSVTGLVVSAKCACEHRLIYRFHRLFTHISSNVHFTLSWQNAKSDILKVTNRVDSVVTFTLIRFLQQTLNQYFSNTEISFTAFWVTVAATVLKLVVVFKKLRIIDSLFTTMQRLALLIANQAAISTQSVVTPLFFTDVILMIVKVTALLIVFFVASSLAKLPAYTDQSLTLLLYMYTDAIQGVINSLDLRMSGAVLFVGVYCLMRCEWEDVDSESSLLAFFGRGIIMLSVNVAMAEIGRQIVDEKSQSIALVFFIFTLDVMTDIYAGFSDARDFCIWRSAQTFYSIYSRQNITISASFSLGIVLFFAKDISQAYSFVKFSTTWSSVLTLVLVNMLLDVASPNNTNHSPENIFTIFTYVIVMHQVSGFLTKSFLPKE